jgi:hypothetical protein
MKIAGELIRGGYECVCVSEMMEIVGELEESMDEKVSDSATLLLKKLYSRREGDEKERGVVTVSGLIREKEKERKEKEAERKEKEEEREEKEEALKREQQKRKEKEKEREEKEKEKKAKEIAMKENERLKRKFEELKTKSEGEHKIFEREQDETKQEIRELRKKQSLPKFPRSSFNFLLFSF